MSLCSSSDNTGGEMWVIFGPTSTSKITEAIEINQEGDIPPLSIVITGPRGESLAAEQRASSRGPKVSPQFFLMFTSYQENLIHALPLIQARAESSKRSSLMPSKRRLTADDVKYLVRSIQCSHVIAGR
jgi:hypothetical protein